MSITGNITGNIIILFFIGANSTRYHNNIIIVIQPLFPMYYLAFHSIQVMGVHW
jgi:hypothetical protein